MKQFTKIIFVLLTGILFSCEKTSPENPVEALILQQTCGGTVVKFTSVDFGEEWVDPFDDFQNHSNVALTADLEGKGFEEGDIVVFSFEETKFLKGDNFCDIAGLPETKIKMQDVRLKKSD